MTQRLIKNGLQKPRLLILTMPWFQMVSKQTPSYHRDAHMPSHEFSLTYLGYEELSSDMLSIFDSNEHLLLLDWPTRLNYHSRLNLYSVPAQNQINDSYFNEYKTNGLNLLSTTQTSLNDSILTRDKAFAQKILNLFSDEMSPGLADDEILAEYPTTHMLICNRDPLRDEAFIFLERLKRLNVDVNYGLFECKHSFNSEKMLVENQELLNFLERELGLMYNL
jgi:acetyl esterase/lipase